MCDVEITFSFTLGYDSDNSILYISRKMHVGKMWYLGYRRASELRIGSPGSRLKLTKAYDVLVDNLLAFFVDGVERQSRHARCLFDLGQTRVKHEYIAVDSNRFNTFKITKHAR